MIESEEFRAKMLKRKKEGEILQGCENSHWKFHRLRNFATLLPVPVDCFLTLLFVVLYKFTLDVILVPLYTFIISLVLSTYISSVLLVNQRHSVHQSIKRGGHEASSPRLVL